VAGAAEFDSVSARQSERGAVDSVLLGQSVSLEEPGHRKVLAILRSGMNGSTPADLRSDAWVIRSNAARLLVALREFTERLATPRAANLVSRIEARLEHGVSEDAVGLTTIDGVGPKWASKLATGGLETPADVRAAGVDELQRAGMSEGVAEQVVESAGGLPDVSVDWGAFPDRIVSGENELCEVTVRNDGGGARAGVRVTVNGIEMTATATYLGTTTVPVGVFGGTEDEMEFAVHVAFADLPLREYVETRTVTVQ